jgi:quercetin dioxygenase-like cupin family protein
MSRLATNCITLAAAVILSGGSTAIMAQERAMARMPDAAELDWSGCPGFMPDGCRIAVLHGDPSEPNADIFYRVPGGADVPRHWHNSPERMVLVTGEMSVTYDGQDTVTLTPGTYAYGPARKPHMARCRSQEPCTLFIAFVDPVDAFEDAP